MSFIVTATGNDGEPWHSAEYTAYLQSPAWQRTRMRVLSRSGGRCETCGATAVHVHHLTYERLGNEYMSDLLAVCEDCHLKHDAAYRAQREAERTERRRAWKEQQTQYEERQRHWEEEAKRRQQERLYETELNRWARKRYGTSWALWGDKAKIAAEFDAWLEDRRRLHEESTG